MSKALRYVGSHPIRFAPFRQRPLVYSAALAAALAALFQPIPAMAAPPAPPAPGSPVTIPDVGSRPTQPGALVLPGTPATSTTVTPVTSLTGTTVSPIVQKIEKGRAEIAALGDQLIRVGQDRDLARTQVATADQRVVESQETLRTAQTEAVEAAGTAMREAAALPPGATGSDLLDLDSLARLQRGDATSDEAAAERLDLAEVGNQLALDEHVSATGRYTRLAAEWTRLNTRLTQKQAAQQKLERDNATELSAAETSQNAADQQLGSGYLAGSEAGRSADSRAITAVKFALAQRGDPYVWSEEGPNQYDCSGLMFAAYRSVGFPLVRVSRDQYYQTRNKAVSRYSLLPGDLLFFSSSNSWTGIHHVAMYAGDGMMVEAPRTGLNVRLAPVRWSRLFQATRIFGSIEGDAELPDLGSPDPDPEATGGTPANPKPRPTTGVPSPSRTKPPASTPASPGPKPSPTTTTTTTPSANPSPTTTSPSANPSPTTTSPSPAPSPSPSPTTTSPKPSPSKSASQPVASPSPTTKTPSQTTSSSNAAEEPSPSSPAATAASVSPSASASSGGK